MNITVSMDEHDFEQLADNSMKWSGGGWEEQLDRFLPYGNAKEVCLSYSFAYWYPNATSMLLARSFLDAAGEHYQVLFDEADGTTPYVITTDYASRAW